MLSRRTLGIVAFTTGLSVASACGTGGDQVATSDAGTGGGVSSTSIELPDRASSGEVPDLDVEDPTKVLASNPNDRSTPMGALCWARWEAARHLLLSATAGKSPEAVVQDMAVGADVVPGRPQDLPVDVAPFADRLFAAHGTLEAESARSKVDVAQLQELFDFERFPAAQQYAEAAAKDPGCVRP